MQAIKQSMVLAVFLLSLFCDAALAEEAADLSADTQTCLGCHQSVMAGIHADWSAGRMARVSPKQALKRPVQQRRISAQSVPDALSSHAVGCAECHTLRPDQHADTFEHNGYQVHTVVTPKDCAVCHPVEENEYNQNVMSAAYGNLNDNPVYRQLADNINGLSSYDDAAAALIPAPPDALTDADSCFSCHGTRLTVKPPVERETEMGPMAFPVISGWPNQGVGRINPDGSRGSCAACHARHRFSIEMARRPDTCSQCHKGPDVPAYKVYAVSKHGNIYAALSKSGNWNFDAVPWTAGIDFTAPTCAACHASLITAADGQVIARRTHRMNDRLAWRIFGLIYAHPHPESPDTSVIRNKDGLSLPTAFDGTPADGFLISKEEMGKRTRAMQQVCSACHSSEWVAGHFRRFEHTVSTTNTMVKTATDIMAAAWEKKAVRGIADQQSPFDEAMERRWVEQWLFFGNSTRFSSAMGGADYGAFADGRWYMSKTPHELLEMLKNMMPTPAMRE